MRSWVCRPANCVLSSSMVEKPRRGRLPNLPILRATPFNDREKLAAAVEDLRASVGGDLWVGYSKLGVQEYRRVRGPPPIRDRTFTDWAKEWDEALTQDVKKFYFEDPIPDKVRERIRRVRVGGRPTPDMILFAVRDPAGRTAAWLAKPRADRVDIL